MKEQRAGIWRFGKGVLQEGGVAPERGQEDKWEEAQQIQAHPCDLEVGCGRPGRVPIIFRAHFFGAAREAEP